MQVTNAQLADVFRSAKKRLYRYMPQAGMCRFICHAIGERTIAHRTARKIIEDRIQAGGCWGRTLDTWVVECSKANVTWEMLDTQAAQLKMQTTRHAWLDSLIAEFDKKALKD